MEQEQIFELFERHHSNNAGFCRHYLELYSIVLGMETQNAFEFGSGYSTKTILNALSKTGGNLITCDIRPFNETAIFYDKESLKQFKNWEYICGNSLSVVPTLTKHTFDFVLHDGAHKKEIVYKDMLNIFPKMKKGSVFLLHDTLHPTDNYGLIDAVTEIGKKWKFNYVTLPYGYGITILTIEEDFGNGSINIKWRKQQ